VAEHDADVNRRLKQAGGVLIDKTNLHEFAMGGTSATSFYGPVRNPWALDRNPGAGNSNCFSAPSTTPSPISIWLSCRRAAERHAKIRAHLRRVLRHPLVGMRASLLTQVAEWPDIAPHQRLQADTNRAQNRSRPDDDAPHDSEIALDTIAIQRTGRGDHVSVDYR
jgi:hypothetical protein